ncbi:MAG: TolC family protein [Planctomycetes bacterium]|nr:TolC family protein [Planctomycetota bacterium]
MRRLHGIRLGWVLLAAVAAGCARPIVPQLAPVPRRPLGAELKTYDAPREAPEGAAAPTADEPKAALALREALALALLHSPELAGASWDLRVAEAKMLQAGLRPNPELEAGFEGFGGTGDKRGLKGLEATLQLSQVIELGGKRLKRVRAAAAEGRLAAWDYEAKRLDVLTDTAKAFVEAVAAQERVKLAEELAALAERVLGVVAERVRAGKVAPLEEHKAKAELATARIGLGQARHKAEAARRRLVTLWGGTVPAFERVLGDLAVPVSDFNPQSQWAGLAALLKQNPDIARWEDEMQQRQAALELERANRIPNLSLSPGLGYFGESEDAAMLLGLVLPLPIFDRNQGGILEARYRAAKALEEKRAAEAKARAELAVAYGELASAFEEVRGIQAEVLPASQAAYALANEGFKEGKFAFLDVLDAQRTLFEARGDLIAALAEYHKALAEVERLIGQSFVPTAAASRKEGG